MSTLQEQELVVQAGKELVKRGLIARTWGNVSCRIDEKTFIITPSGRDYMSLTPEQIVTVDMDTLAYNGDIKPSSEKGAHAEVYKAKPSAKFVIHTHQENASILSACGLDNLEVDELYKTLKGLVLVTGYGLPSTKKLARNIGSTVRKSNGHGIIMRNHGALCYGSTYEETFQAAVELEEACGDYINKIYPQREDSTAVNQGLRKKIIDELHPFFQFVETLSSADCLTAAKLNQKVRPMVDDFAQIIGLKMVVVKPEISRLLQALKKNNAVLIEGVGAVCVGATLSDVQAIKMIASKTVRAHLCAMQFGKLRPINQFESKLMNVIYKKKYSKQI